MSEAAKPPIDRPVKSRCNECGREVKNDADFSWIPFDIARGFGEGVWYPQCRYCRAKYTRRKNREKKACSSAA